MTLEPHGNSRRNSRLYYLLWPPRSICGYRIHKSVRICPWKILPNLLSLRRLHTCLADQFLVSLYEQLSLLNKVRTIDFLIKKSIIHCATNLLRHSNYTQRCSSSYHSKIDNHKSGIIRSVLVFRGLCANFPRPEYVVALICIADALMYARADKH